MMDRHQNAFKEEAYELLGELETALMELEDKPEDSELIGRVFRAMHTIKGSGAMFGFDAIASFTHDVETVFDHVRNGRIAVCRELIDLTLSARDHIHQLLDGREEDDEQNSRAAGIVARFRQFLPESECNGGDSPKAPGDTPAIPAAASRTDIPQRDGAQDATYRIRFRPAPGIFATGTYPIMLLDELRGLGPCRIVAHTDAIPDLEEIDPEVCYTYWDIILTTDRGPNAIQDVFIFIDDAVELKIEPIDAEESDGRKIGEIMVERGDLAVEDLKKVLASRKRIGQDLIETGLVPPDKVQAALAEQEHIKEIRKERQAVEAAASIRVPAERLDTLVNLVGELVTMQSRLTQTASRKNDTDLILISEEVERLTAELRDTTMGIRMLPIGSTFSKFKRLVRDLSAELGKEIAFQTEGAETELDKTVIEKLNDPLVHLIRNCIDHGIERPEARVAAGKPPQGEIHLSALHAGANVMILIRDDGAGIDKDAVLRKAAEKGLVAPDAVLSEKETFGLIFAPGFSTAEKITSVSGRGVGMDVVKRSIDSLHGSIEITSLKGAGTTITLKLPLTLAIIDGLLVRIGGSHFVMPLSLIEECVELTREDVRKAHGQKLAHIRGEVVPYIHLRERFEVPGKPPAIEQIVTTRVDGCRLGFVVDQVIGQHQTVLKSLGRFYRNIDEISGATILGNGEVALIIDLPKLFLNTEAETRLQNHQGLQT